MSGSRARQWRPLSSLQDAAASTRLQAIAASVVKMTDAQWAACGQKKWDDPEQHRRLFNLAKAALEANPRNWDAAKDAVYKMIRPDAELLWALIEPYRAMAVQKLLTEAGGVIRGAPEPNWSGINRPATSPQAKEPTHRPPAPTRSGMTAAANVAKLSFLDTFKINGVPIGDCTPTEANEWATRRLADTRFVFALTANLPPHEPIRAHRTAEDAETMMIAAHHRE